MHGLQRIYAHTAWTPLDPLAGLDPVQRRSILMMRSTFFERLRMMPWRDYEKRRAAMLDIIAERRVVYDLMFDRQQTAVPVPSQSSPPAHVHVAGVAHPVGTPQGADSALSPFYAYRMEVHRRAMEAMAEERMLSDLSELAHNPAAQADQAMRDQRRRALLEIDIERKRLDLKELAVRAGDAKELLPSTKQEVWEDVSPMAPPLTSPEKRRRPSRSM